MEEPMRLIAIALILAVLVTPATAQFGNPAGVDPASPQSAPGVPARHHANTQDKIFAQLAAAGGIAEVELGKLAEHKAESSGVKEFAGRMVQDHTRANEQLTQLAKQAQIPLPTGPGPDHKLLKTELEKIGGRNFDLTYMQGQVVDHQKTVILLQYEIGQGQEGELQKFASDTLPIVLAHLERARSLVEELTLLAHKVSTK